MEETGWKLVHGDVFRPPRYPKIFAAVIGSGIQIFLMTFITICKLHQIILLKLRIFLIYSCIYNERNSLEDFERI